MFVKKCREYSLPLIAGVLVALVWANVGSESYHHFIHYPLFGLEAITPHFLVNDIFMVFFFAIAGIEIVHSLSPGGALNPIKKAVTPLMATAGGVIGPIVVFFILNAVMGAPEFSNGWGIPTATDIALAWLVARVVFGEKHPAVSFLLLLAVADDAVGLVIIAVFYPDPAKPVQPLFLVLVVVGMVIAFLFKKVGVRHPLLYVIIPGLISWFGMFSAGLHPALSLIFIIPFMPKSPLHAEVEIHDQNVGPWTLDRFENAVSPVVDFGLFFFGLTNAGVEFSEISNLTWIIFLALIIGKTCGVSLFSFIATKVGFSLPQGMHKKDVIVAGMVAGMGLTVALFVAGSAFTDISIMGAAKMGALFSAAAALIAIVAGRSMKIKRMK